MAAMRRAVALAAAAVGRTNPNPAVGAVVIGDDGAVIAEGATEAAGGAHAEVVALTAAGGRALGATLVVTLEPCRHFGRTPPCTDAIVAAGIRRVVVGVRDPNEVAAGGALALRAAGVDVETGVLQEEAAAHVRPWLVAVRRGRPCVTWKYAATLDGRTAAGDGTSRWITGADARRDVHRLRSSSDAVVVGIGTVLADDPALTVRDWPATRQPLRVVVDSAARTPIGARVLDGSAPTLVAVTTSAAPEQVKRLRDTGADVVELPARSGRVDLTALVGALGDRAALQVMVEGGATLAGGFVRDRLVDRVVAYLAPKLLGDGTAVLSGAGLDTVSSAVGLRIDEVTRVGDDVCISAWIEEH
jgi:diaminohydroxyphosphoribosylaminopyrimidine deaminase/5-amino-6-(5-phosphoribosylamino)uracil reductase